MKVTPVGVILEHLAKGAVIECVEGVLTKLHARKQNKPEDEKQWSIQNGELKGDDGNTIPLFINECPEFDKGWVGHRIRLVAKHGDRGLTGLYAYDDTYQGANTRKLKITATAILEDGTQPHQETGPPPPQQQKSTQKPANASHPSSATSTPPALSQAQSPPPAKPRDPVGAVTHLKKTVAQIATVYGACFDGAVLAAIGIFERHGHAMSPQAIGIVADKFFIDTMRKVDLPSLPMPGSKHLPEFKGKKLSEFMPSFLAQIDENRTRTFEFEEQQKAKHTPPPVQPTTPPPQPKPQPQPEPTPQGKDEWPDEREIRRQGGPVTPPHDDGLEEDDIPF